MSEFVTPYADDNKPILCNSCGEDRTIGLRVRQGVQFGHAEPVGFICIYCIARMWNTPTTVPHEPAADEREVVPIFETDEAAELPEQIFSGSAEQVATVLAVIPDLEVGQEYFMRGRTYRVVRSQAQGKYYSLEAVEG